MSSAVIREPRVKNTKCKITIVASIFNEMYTDALVKFATERIHEKKPNAIIDVIRVPGAFEIPSVVSLVLEKELPHAVIALGVILRGDTQHADLIAEACTHALMQLSIKNKCPIIHEVLLLDDESQAHERTQGKEMNRGIEAADAALNMIDVFEDIIQNSFNA
jgi:6,7-dimethyl-8-ribityllumazine synthase